MSQKIHPDEIGSSETSFPEALGAPCMNAFKCDVRHGTVPLNVLVVFHGSVALISGNLDRFRTCDIGITEPCSIRCATSAPGCWLRPSTSARCYEHWPDAPAHLFRLGGPGDAARH